MLNGCHSMHFAHALVHVAGLSHAVGWEGAVPDEACYLFGRECIKQIAADPSQSFDAVFGLSKCAVTDDAINTPTSPGRAAFHKFRWGMALSGGISLRAPTLVVPRVKIDLTEEAASDDDGTSQRSGTPTLVSPPRTPSPPLPRQPQPAAAEGGAIALSAAGELRSKAGAQARRQNSTHDQVKCFCGKPAQAEPASATGRMRLWCAQRSCVFSQWADPLPATNGSERLSEPVREPVISACSDGALTTAMPGESLKAPHGPSRRMDRERDGAKDHAWIYGRTSTEETDSQRSTHKRQRTARSDFSTDTPAKHPVLISAAPNCFCGMPASAEPAAATGRLRLWCAQRACVFAEWAE